MSYPDVWITKHGFEVRQWNGEVRQTIIVEDPDPMLHYLRMPCHIEDGVTLRDIFNAVDQHPDLIKLIENWSWCNVAAFHAEARKPGASTLHYIEISRYVELDEFVAGNYLDIHGIGPLSESEAKHHFGDSKAGDIIENWGLDFTPVNELADFPVRLNPTLEARKVHSLEVMRSGGGYFQDLGTYPASYTLLDVIGEIYYEISFHGSPESRDERNADLRGMVADIEQGTATLVEWKPDEPTVQ